MFTVLVVPVIGAIVAAPPVIAPGVLDAAPPVVVVVVAELVSTATCVVSPGLFSPPAQAPSIITPTAIANPWNRIF
jgi:hypothetical protein